MFICWGRKWSRVTLKLVSHSTVAIRQLSLTNTKPLTLPTGATVKNYLDEKQFNYVEGYASYMLECPICDTAVKQQNMVPQYCMHINKTTGSVKCPPCKLSGKVCVCVCLTFNHSIANVDF